MRPIWRRLTSERRAATAVVVAVALPMLFGVTALAVDLGVVHLETRRLQGVADASALHAVGALNQAQSRAEAMVTASRGRYGVDTRTTTGRYRGEAGVPAASRFQPNAPQADAVRVVLSGEVPTFFAAIFGTRSVAIERRATARRIDMASFSIGSRLASLEGGVANALLSGLTGSEVALSVMDYRALAGAKVDLVPWIGALGTSARLNAASFDEVLNAELSGSAVIRSIADQVADPVAREALTRLAGAAKGTIRLAHLIDLGEVGRQDSGGSGLVRVDALDLAGQIIQGSASQRQVALDLGANVPGLASTRVYVAIGERPANAPWIALTRDLSPIVRTAQTRIYVQTRLGAQLTPGVGLASVELPVFIELASAEARLERIECTPARVATIGARPSPGLAAIARIDPSRLGDFNTPIARQNAHFLNVLLLLRIEGQATLNLGGAESFQPLRFEQPMIDSGEPQKVRSTTIVGGVASSLRRDMTLRPVLLGLPIPVDPVLRSVGGQLDLLAPALDPVIATLTSTLGVGVGEADVWVTGLRCGQPVLVE